MAKTRIYDIEKEFAEDRENNNTPASSMNFLQWLREADAGDLTRRQKKNVQKQVIDRFIATAPKIKPVSKDDEMYEPLVLDESKSVNQEIVSETLARIYIEQQHYARAKEVYRKLILLYPEKSNYFATLLKDCKKQEQANRK